MRQRALQRWRALAAVLTQSRSRVGMLMSMRNTAWTRARVTSRQSLTHITAFFNLLDMPAGVLPVTTATAADDAALLSSYPQKDPWDKRVVAAASGAAGLPIGVQVAALPWEDEICLRVMKEVEDAVAFRPSGGEAQETSI